MSEPNGFSACLWLWVSISLHREQEWTSTIELGPVGDAAVVERARIEDSGYLAAVQRSVRPVSRLYTEASSPAAWYG